MPAFLEVKNTGLFFQGAEASQLIVRSFETEVDAENGIAIYRGGVRATFGQTELKADVLIVRKGKPGDPPVSVEGQLIKIRPFEAYAVGKVDVIDPDGTLQASNLWFTWDPVRRESPTEVVGRAENVSLKLGSVHVEAKGIILTKPGMELTSAGFWTGNWKTPLFRFDAESLFIFPGKKGVARRVKTSLLGLNFPIIPQYTFSLDPRTQGLTIPSIGYRQDAGIGMAWQRNFLLNDSTSIEVALAAYPKVQPTYTLAYAHSNLKEQEIGRNQFAITNQFGERSGFSFFENIYSESLSSTFDRMRILKDLFFVGSTFNYETVGRVTDRVTNYSLPLEIGLEKGGPAGSGAYLLQAKVARVVEGGNRSATRLTLGASSFSPLLTFGRVTAGTRFEALGRLDPSSSGYVGLESGFSYAASNSVSLSAGAYGYKTFGSPLFQGDQFRTNQGYVLRGDLTGSATNISFMFRYDPTQGWFDREYRISQVMGPIEPVIAYRQSPRQYVIGIKFRTEDIAKLLQKRSIKRSSGYSTEGVK